MLRYPQSEEAKGARVAVNPALICAVGGGKACAVNSRHSLFKPK